jgi:hypothetical protein
MHDVVGRLAVRRGLRRGIGGAQRDVRRQGAGMGELAVGDIEPVELGDVRLQRLSQFQQPDPRARAHVGDTPARSGRVRPRSWGGGDLQRAGHYGVQVVPDEAAPEMRLEVEPGGTGQQEAMPARRTRDGANTRLDDCR